MIKFSKILYAAMALAMAVCNFSCSDDEELPTGDLELNSGSSVTTETLKVLSYSQRLQQLCNLGQRTGPRHYGH